MDVRRTATATTAGLAAVAAVSLAGLQVPPRPFPPFPQQSAPLQERVPLPATLPAPVQRWLHGVYGDSVPVITSVVVTGRGRVNPFGAWMPARFRFIHDAGRSYRHYIEATWFRRPVLRVNERYVDGRSLIEIPIVGRDEGPQVEQAANLGMWAELAAAAPAVLVTDPRVAWRPVDDHRAVLEVPFEPSQRDEFTAHFDPDSGELRELHCWRYRDSRAGGKTMWIARNEPGRKVPGTGLPAVGSATWADQGRPWARFVTEDLRVNVDVAEALQHIGL
jgi:hypothetical protein